MQVELTLALLTLKVFFSKEWLEAFLTSFRNFLTLIFRSMPLPKLLAFQLTRLEEPSLKMRLRVSQSECNRLRYVTLPFYTCDHGKSDGCCPILK